MEENDNYKYNNINNNRVMRKKWKYYGNKVKENS